LDREEKALMNAGPHPLEKFAVDGLFVEDIHAQVLTDFIVDATLGEPDSSRALAALWVLLESRQLFFLCCDGAGIDGEKLREHLRKSLERRGSR